jgi:hypothetical protein
MTAPRCVSCHVPYLRKHCLRQLTSSCCPQQEFLEDTVSTAVKKGGAAGRGGGSYERFIQVRRLSPN